MFMGESLKTIKRRRGENGESINGEGGRRVNHNQSQYAWLLNEARGGVHREMMKYRRENNRHGNEEGHESRNIFG